MAWQAGGEEWVEGKGEEERKEEGSDSRTRRGGGRRVPELLL